MPIDSLPPLTDSDLAKVQDIVDAWAVTTRSGQVAVYPDAFRCLVNGAGEALPRLLDEVKRMRAMISRAEIVAAEKISEARLSGWRSAIEAATTALHVMAATVLANGGGETREAPYRQAAEIICDLPAARSANPYQRSHE